MCVCVCVCVFGEEGSELLQLCICRCQGYQEMNRTMKGQHYSFAVCVSECACVPMVHVCDHPCPYSVPVLTL